MWFEGEFFFQHFGILKIFLDVTSARGDTDAKGAVKIKMKKIGNFHFDGLPIIANIILNNGANYD